MGTLGQSEASKVDKQMVSRDLAYRSRGHALTARKIPCLEQAMQMAGINSVIVRTGLNAYGSANKRQRSYEAAFVVWSFVRPI